MEPFRIHVADEALNDLRARLRNARWPDQTPGIGWEQGTELNWLRRLVSYWAHEFDWRGWERRLNAFNHFTWEDIHFVYQRAASGGGVPLILTHGWPSSFLDYMDMLPMLEHFDVVVPSLPGYGFSPRPPKVGINYRYVSERLFGSIFVASMNPASIGPWACAGRYPKSRAGCCIGAPNTSAAVRPRERSGARKHQTPWAC